MAALLVTLVSAKGFLAFIVSEFIVGFGTYVLAYKSLLMSYAMFRNNLISYRVSLVLLASSMEVARIYAADVRQP